MSQPITQPTYPVVDSDPSVGKVFSAIRSSDWRTAAFLTAISLPFGYLAGRPILMRPSMWAAGTFGATAGVLMGWQASFARLAGFAENTAEVTKYGEQPSVLNESTA